MLTFQIQSLHKHIYTLTYFTVLFKVNYVQWGLSIAKLLYIIRISRSAICFTKIKQNTIYYIDLIIFNIHIKLHSNFNNNNNYIKRGHLFVKNINLPYPQQKLLLKFPLSILAHVKLFPFV